ncbi:outer membrane protein assembly factor BamE [Vreelandella rituensis]|nr:outer membrane protein assembly factor BamE [Halomonas rituensis]
MQKLTRIVALSVTLSATVLVASGCSYVGVYKRDLPQGNLVTQGMVSQLQPGMTQEQVTYLMGSPLLQAPFDSNEWDYVFRLDKAYEGVEQRRVTLVFGEDGRLEQIQREGNMTGDLDLPTAEDRAPARQRGVLDEPLPETPRTAPDPEPVPIYVPDEG